MLNRSLRRRSRRLPHRHHLRRSLVQARSYQPRQSRLTTVPVLVLVLVLPLRLVMIHLVSRSRVLEQVTHLVGCLLRRRGRTASVSLHRSLEGSMGSTSTSLMMPTSSRRRHPYAKAVPRQSSHLVTQTKKPSRSSTHHQSSNLP
jgi:hypothetical protein